MIVINLWGEPGAGKSTTTNGLAFLLKINKYKVEPVNEVAKEMVWEGLESMFGDQISIFAEQNRRLLRLEPHGLDFAISDSPLPLPIIYKPEGYLRHFDALVMEQFNHYNNINYLLQRTASFETIGRRHNEEESVFLAGKIRRFMDEWELPYTVLEANPRTPETIMADLRRRAAAPVMSIPFLESSQDSAPE